MGEIGIGRALRTRLSPWVELVARDISYPGHAETQTFHSLAQADYVNVVAVTADGCVALVRQYRPAVQGYTLELPGGLRESNEDPATTAARELLEETGHRSHKMPELLACFFPDPGRLENRMWGYFLAEVAPDPAAVAEVGVEPVLMKKKDVLDLVLDGRFEHGMHAGLIALAALKGLL
jgi:ADP-ribose pyrophosphatase